MPKVIRFLVFEIKETEYKFYSFLTKTFLHTLSCNRWWKLHFLYTKKSFNLFSISFRIFIIFISTIHATFFFHSVTSAITSKRKIKQKLKNAPKSNLRHSQTLATNEKYTSEDVEMSQAASELLKEFKGTTTENMLMSNDFEKPTRRKSSTTMKIYLKGSSRLPVPLPENNAFCYAYPHNALCGSVM